MPEVTCQHKDRKPSSDGQLELCASCGVIIRALTSAGAQEVRKLQAKWRVK